MTCKRRVTPIIGEQLPLDIEVLECYTNGSKIIKRVLKKTALYKVGKVSKKVTLQSLED